MTPSQPGALDQDLEAMAARLSESGAYRVLRRLGPQPETRAQPGERVRSGLFVDVETTGLDPARDEIIELAMTPFAYTSDGRVLQVGSPFQGLREPSKPIPREITDLTGIDDAMVAGRTIDPEDVAVFAAPAALVIAHNASFDRRFLERFSDVFTTKAWGCSLSQVDWASEGYEGTKLAYLLAGAGFFHEGHRAADDCLAAITILSQVQPRTGRTALAQLLERARRPSFRIWAENAPFDLKEQLKSRGYRWNADGLGGPRAWYVDTEEAHRDAELAFLRTEIYRRDVDLRVRRVDAYDRFSERC